MAKSGADSRIDGLSVLLNALGAAGAAPPNASAADDNVIVIDARPPRIEISLRSDVASAPPSEETLTRWKAGLRPAAADADDANVIEIYESIGYDWWTGGGVTAKSIGRKLDDFGGADCTVRINSPGGDMFEGIAIYNVLQGYKGKITVEVLGLAASAASIIAMAGDVRLMGDAAFIMIHNAWVVAIGNRHDMQEVADYLEPFDNALRDIYVKRTGQKTNQVETWMDEETFFGTKKSIELGFATGEMPAKSIKEDTAKTKASAQFNTVRSVERMLTKNGMTRSAARSMLQELKGTKPSAGVGEGDTPGAVPAVTATQDAGQSAELVAGLKALLAKF